MQLEVVDGWSLLGCGEEALEGALAVVDLLRVRVGVRVGVGVRVRVRVGVRVRVEVGRESIAPLRVECGVRAVRVPRAHL